jgi:hypothetical protein
MGESVKGEFWVKAAERSGAGFTQKNGCGFSWDQ